MIGLQNGCICCSIQGDFLRTLKTVLSQPERPDVIAVEASGVSEHAGIISTIWDLVMSSAMHLNKETCVVDIADLPDHPMRFNDPMWQAQTQCADILAFSKGKGAATGLAVEVHKEKPRSS